MIFFIRKTHDTVLPISARDTTSSERRYYNAQKNVEPTPDNFERYEAAADFWDTHDTTDYLDEFRTVEVNCELRARHFEVEIVEKSQKS